MKKVFLPVVLLFLLCLLCGCDAEELGSLEDLSLPYTGVYECERLDLGGKDKLKDFEYVRLELKYGGAFAVAYRTEDGLSGSLGGSYTVDTERETITFRAAYGRRTLQRTFPMKKGVVLVEENFLGTPLFAEFKM